MGFTTLKVGNLTKRNPEGKFVEVGKVTLGNDERGNLKVIINVGNETMSAFLNDAIKRADFVEFMEWKKKNKKL